MTRLQDGFHGLTAALAGEVAGWIVVADSVADVLAHKGCEKLAGAVREKIVLSVDMLTAGWDARKGDIAA